MARVQLLVDTHVHCQPAFAPGDMLDGAAAHFARAAAALGAQDPLGCLALADTPGNQAFARLAAAAGGGPLGRWRVSATAEPVGLLVRAGEARLAIIAGRQIATREGLEVLSLASAAEIPDGLDLAATLDLVVAAGGVAVVPWGFGKWWFGRDLLVKQALSRPGAPPLFLGDNAGRARGGPRPRLFRWAAARGIAVLAGSDPLPLAAEADRAGSYGIVLEGEVDEGRPAAAFRRLLTERRAQPRDFGARAPLGRAALNQLRLRLARRGRGAGVGAVPAAGGRR